MNLFDFARAHEAMSLPAIEESRIAEFEVERGLTLPDGLREFYREAGGTMDFTEWSWRIWPFEELATLDQMLQVEPDVECLKGHAVCPKLSDYVAFIDVLIEAQLYAVCANIENPRFGEVVTLAGDSEPFLAGPIASFEEFLQILGIHWADVVLPDSLRFESRKNLDVLRP